ncbi:MULTISPECIES: hypothetical protein [unclassified Bartonella]|uniref:hypothetical protein n=2 Tax=Bartonella TaxID=773 RepID=UPI0035CED611
MLEKKLDVFTIARIYCPTAFQLIDVDSNLSLNDYALVTHNASQLKFVGSLVQEERKIFAECLYSEVEQRWGSQRAQRAHDEILQNPVIQTGPHYRLMFDNDFSSTMAFSIRGHELMGNVTNMMFTCSTVTLEEHARCGPAWLRIGDTSCRIFEMPRRRLAKKSVSEYQDDIALSSEVQSWLRRQFLKATFPEHLLNTKTAIVTHINNLNEYVFEQFRQGHNISTITLREPFFAIYAIELLERPSFMRRLIDDGRLVKLVELLKLESQGLWKNFIPTATDLFWLSVEGRVRPLQLRDGALYSDRFRVRIDFETNSIVQNLRTGRLVPSLFFIFLSGSLLPRIRFLGGAYQVLYQEIFQKILLKILKMDVQDERRLAEDILSTIVTAWGHNVVQKNAWHQVQKNNKGALRFSFKNWASPLSLMSSHYASFTQDLRWKDLTEKINTFCLKNPGLISPSIWKELSQCLL